MFKRIKTFFNDLAARQEEKRIFKNNFAQLTTAVEKADAATVDSLLASVTASRFYNRNRKQSLIESAVQSDDKDIFVKVLNGQSPDIWLTSDTSLGGPESPYYYSREHILHRAIATGKKNVALFLAQHPDTDVLAVGYDQKTFYVSGGSLLHTGHIAQDISEHRSPLMEAKVKGMQEIVDVLAERVKTAAPKSPAPPKSAF